MTPRLEAWLRQANNDLAMADYALAGGFHAQACYHASQAASQPTPTPLSVWWRNCPRRA
jgi:HEPN domain-containing protein